LHEQALKTSKIVVQTYFGFHEDVLRLKVPMCDLARVEILDALRDLVRIELGVVFGEISVWL